jgi:hypothetical protein
VSDWLRWFLIAIVVLAGFGGVVLLAVNYRKQRVTENEHALAVEKAERETVQGFNERLGTAAEQLAHDSPAVRLTGVYALAGLADDWEDKRQVCVDVLCGYLRLQPDVMTPGEAEVRQAILRMIRDRLTGFLWWRRPVDFDFTGVAFENADFSGLRFRGRVILDGAEFSGELTSFDRALLSVASAATARASPPTARRSATSGSTRRRSSSARSSPARPWTASPGTWTGGSTSTAAGSPAKPSTSRRCPSRRVKSGSNRPSSATPTWTSACSATRGATEAPSRA